MTDEAFLRGAFVALEVNDDFSEAELSLRDATRLCFRHRVGERWAKAVGAGQDGGPAGLAGEVLARVAGFRLNARHLDLHFADGSRWEARFADRRGRP
jgi:hypothetical protein